MPSSAVNRKASAVLPVSLLAFIGVLVSLLLAAEWSCTLSSSFSCWLSSPWFAGSPPRDYLPGEVLPLRATEATSVRTLLPLPPYHLPSCRPATIRESHVDFGARLVGSRVASSPIMYLADGMPVVQQVTLPTSGDQDPSSSTALRLGVPLGAAIPRLHSDDLTQDDVALHNHIDFEVTLEQQQQQQQQHGNPSAMRVLAVHAQPRSMAGLQRCDTAAGALPQASTPQWLTSSTTEQGQEEEEEKEEEEEEGGGQGVTVEFTYSVAWRFRAHSPDGRSMWASRWDGLLLDHVRFALDATTAAAAAAAATGAHNTSHCAITVVTTQNTWYSGLAVLLVALTALAWRRTRAMVASIPSHTQALDGSQAAPAGWLKLHADIFRPPEHVWDIAVVVGVGLHVAMAVFLLLAMGAVGLVSPALGPGAILGSGVLCLALTSCCGGYFTSRAMGWVHPACSQAPRLTVSQQPPFTSQAATDASSSALRSRGGARSTAQTATATSGHKGQAAQAAAASASAAPEHLSTLKLFVASTFHYPAIAVMLVMPVLLLGAYAIMMLQVAMPGLITASAAPAATAAQQGVDMTVTTVRPSSGLVAALLGFAAATLPLTALGALCGFLRPHTRYPVRLGHVPTPLPTTQRCPPVLGFVLAIVPACAACTDVVSLMQAATTSSGFWNGHGALLLKLVAFLMCHAMIGVTAVTYDLAVENYVWWWRAFMYSAAPTMLILSATALWSLLFRAHVVLASPGFALPALLAIVAALLLATAAGATSVVATRWYLVRLYALHPQRAKSDAGGGGGGVRQPLLSS